MRYTRLPAARQAGFRFALSVALATTGPATLRA